MLLLYCIGEGGEKRQQQPPEQKNMYLYIVAVLDIYHTGDTPPPWACTGNTPGAAQHN